MNHDLFSRASAWFLAFFLIIRKKRSGQRFLIASPNGITNPLLICSSFSLLYIALAETLAKIYALSPFFMLLSVYPSFYDLPATKAFLDKFVET